VGEHIEMGIPLGRRPALVEVGKWVDSEEDNIEAF